MGIKLKKSMKDGSIQEEMEVPKANLVPQEVSKFFRDRREEAKKKQLLEAHEAKVKANEEKETEDGRSTS
jgi:hypothetical protein